MSVAHAGCPTSTFSASRHRVDRRKSNPLRLRSAASPSVGAHDAILHARAEFGKHEPLRYLWSCMKVEL